MSDKSTENKKAKYLNSRRKFISNLTKITILTTPFIKSSFAYAKLNENQLPEFPNGINLSQQIYKNWSGEINAKSVWTSIPKTPSDIVAIVNWAKKYNYKVRPKGKVHNWSPLTIANGLDHFAKVILVDTTSYLRNITINSTKTPSTVTAQTGILMESLLSKLEEHGLGLAATPAIGEITLGGVLAINGHGTGILSENEKHVPLGHTFGSLSNLILSLTAIVWDNRSNQYVLKTFHRTDPNCQAFLVHLGRAFITEVTLQVGLNQRIRCQSIIGISASDLFGPQNSSPFNFANFIEKMGRAEAIWFPFTDKPWLKVWSVTDENKPSASKLVNTPYNYPFSDNISEQLSNFITNIVSGNTSVTPEFGKLKYFITAIGLEKNNAFDLWGWSKNLLLYIKATTLKLTENGYVIITKRENIQRVLNEFYLKYNSLINEYRSRNIYPINGPIEIRITGLDNPKDVINIEAAPPLLSAIKTRQDYEDWDVGIWLDILTIPGTPYSNQFFKEMEEWIYSNYSAPYATVRTEWSKGWAYSNTSAWANTDIMKKTIPNSFREGQNSNNNWDTACSIFNYFDPYRIFSSPLLDSLKL